MSELNRVDLPEPVDPVAEALAALNLAPSIIEGLAAHGLQITPIEGDK